MKPLEKDYSDYKKLLSSGLKTEEALSKMKFSKPPPSGEENYQYLLDMWNHENMCTIRDFLRWYNNKNIVPTLEAMQKMLVFYYKKGIDMLKLRCTLPKLANICLYKSSSAKFYPFTETDKDFFQKIREEMDGDPSIVFTRKAVVDEISGIQGILVNRLLALTQVSCILFLCASPCQQDYTRDGNITQNLLDFNLNRTNPETLRTWLCHASKDKDLTVKIRVSTLQKLRRRLTVSRWMIFAHIVLLCLRLWAASNLTVHVRKHDFL